MASDDDAQDAGAASGAVGCRHSETVCIALTRAQVESVARAISETDRPSLNLIIARLVSSAALSAESLGHYGTEFDGGHLSHSLARGLVILAFFIANEGEHGVTAVARQLGMNSSTAHRYVTTLKALGLLEQDSETRRYRLAR